MRWVGLGLVVLALGGAAAVATADTTGTTVAVCATATTPPHTVAVDGADLTTIAGDTEAQCTTSTVTASTVTVTAPIQADLFDDEFNGTSIDTTKWNVANGTKLNNLVDLPGNVFLDGNGHLIVQTARNSSGGFTGGLADMFQYATGWPPANIKESLTVPFQVDVRMRMPAVAGDHGGAWLINTDAPTSQNIYEIDMAEERTSLPTTGGCHQHTWLGGVDQQPANSSVAITDMAANWHVYTTQVYADHVNDYVDGQLCGTFYGVGAGRQFGMLIDNGIGTAGSWEAGGGQPAATDPGPWQMQVDYVRATSLSP